MQIITVAVNFQLEVPDGANPVSSARASNLITRLCHLGVVGLDVAHDRLDVPADERVQVTYRVLEVAES